MPTLVDLLHRLAYDKLRKCSGGLFKSSSSYEHELSKDSYVETKEHAHMLKDMKILMKCIASEYMAPLSMYAELLTKDDNLKYPNSHDHFFHGTFWECSPRIVASAKFSKAMKTAHMRNVKAMFKGMLCIRYPHAPNSHNESLAPLLATSQSCDPPIGVESSELQLLIHYGMRHTQLIDSDAAVTSKYAGAKKICQGLGYSVMAIWLKKVLAFCNQVASCRVCRASSVWSMWILCGITVSN